MLLTNDPISAIADSKIVYKGKLNVKDIQARHRNRLQYNEIKTIKAWKLVE